MYASAYAAMHCLYNTSPWSAQPKVHTTSMDERATATGCCAVPISHKGHQCLLMQCHQRFFSGICHFADASKVHKDALASICCRKSSRRQAQWHQSNQGSKSLRSQTAVPTIAPACSRLVAAAGLRTHSCCTAAFRLQHQHWQTDVLTLQRHLSSPLLALLLVPGLGSHALRGQHVDGRPAGVDW